MKTTPIKLLALTLLAGCSTPHYYQGYQVGRDYYAHLDKRGQQVFQAGADFATNDLLQREYAAERNSMRYSTTGYSNTKTEELNHKIVPVSVPGYSDPSGVQHDPSYKFIEVNTVQ